MIGKPSGVRDSGQLALDLAFRPAMSREDFLVASSNEAAVAEIDSWPDWRHQALLLVGPEGSGKSHLSQVFRIRAGGPVVAAENLTKLSVPELLATGVCVVEDLPSASNELDEVALFHLLNLARETSRYVLMTARSFPGRWNLELKDLASRMTAVPTVALGTPCDVLLRGLLVKLFADRQVAVDEAVVDFLIRNMERSGDVARRLVELIDRRSLEEKATVTRPFAAKILTSLQTRREAG